MKVDLHLHTTASDGRLTPPEVVQLAWERGLRVISITDHDTTAGLPSALEAASHYPHLSLIPGIELSVDVPQSEVHILGYFINYKDPAFQRALDELRASRTRRARKMVDKLSSLGIVVSWERVKELAQGGVIGRPHIAQAMVEKGYVTYPQEAFKKYLDRGGPAYVEREKLSPEEAVSLILEAGGLPVLAHPGDIAGLEEMVVRLKKAGLVGMEVYCGAHSRDRTEALAELAAREGLIPCGGSDYHASGNPDEIQPGTVGPPLDSVQQLAALAQRRGSIPVELLDQVFTTHLKNGIVCPRL